jgi:hypothetical protein
MMREGHVVVDKNCCGFEVAVNNAVVEKKLEGENLRKWMHSAQEIGCIIGSG